MNNVCFSLVLGNFDSNFRHINFLVSLNVRLQPLLISLLGLLELLAERTI